MTTVEKAAERDAGDVLSLLEEIHDIHHSGRPDIFSSSGSKYSMDDVLKLFADPDSPSFTVRENGEFRGYALCRLRRTEETPHMHGSLVLYIDDLCVKSEFREQGFGSALLKYLADFARKLRCQRVELNVWEFNEGAKKLYERFGFVTQRRQLEFFL